jgi:hypothetical protein
MLLSENAGSADSYFFSLTSERVPGFTVLGSETPWICKVGCCIPANWQCWQA